MTKNRSLGPVIVAAAVGAVFGALFAVRFKPPPLGKIIQPLWISIALYCLFSLYWTVAAKNSAPVKSAEPFSSTLLHQSLLNLALILLFFRVPGLTGRWLLESLALTITGITIQASALVLAIWARRRLGRNWSARVTTKVDHELIQTGPYKLIRHPIYTAVLGMHIGIAITSGEWHALVAVTLVAIAYIRKIRLEEQTLSRAFGEQHATYRQNSWALIPWVL